MRDCKGRVGAIDRTAGRSFLINPNRLVDIRDKGTGSKFLFFDNHLDSREGASYVEAVESVDELRQAYDDDLSSKVIALPVHRNNKPERATDILRIDAEMFAYADTYNPDHTKCWVIYIKNGFKRVEALVNLSLNDILYNTSGEMKYTDTIDLDAGVDTTVTTTLTRIPYSVQLLDSSGNDVSRCLVAITLVGTVYVLTFYSVDALTDCSLYLLY
jgi:hypothetical protein